RHRDGRGRRPPPRPGAFGQDGQARGDRAQDALRAGRRGAQDAQGDRRAPGADPRARPPDRERGPQQALREHERRLSPPGPHFTFSRTTTGKWSLAPRALSGRLSLGPPKRLGRLWSLFRPRGLYAISSTTRAEATSTDQPSWSSSPGETEIWSN